MGEAQGAYVYGVLRRRDGIRVNAAGVGDPPAEVRTVWQDRVGALVSSVPAVPIETTRRNLIAHTAVLQEAMEAAPVLPMRFGVVMPSEEAVREELLRRQYERLDALLDEFENRVEVDVKAFYDEEAVLREIVAENPAIARAREATRGLPPDASYYQRIRLGEAVAKAMEAKRERDAAAIRRRLEPLAVSLRENPEPVERVVVDLALLLERDRVPAFDDALREVAEELAARMRFKSVGPLPPHSFVDLSLPVAAGGAP